MRPLGAVLRLWQGLGYNRRAKLLWECARVIERQDGRFPRSLEELEALPGIGPYTASAVMAFAYNQPVVMLETNIRTAYLHHFFKNKTGVTDRELIPYLERTLDRKHPREWYSALMDYGSYLKSAVGNQNRRSAEYATQSKFAGSAREVRGAILRLLALKSHTPATFSKALPAFKPARIADQLAALEREGLIKRRGRSYRLPGI